MASNPLAAPGLPTTAAANVPGPIPTTATPPGQPAAAGTPGGAFGHYPAVTEPAGQATTANPLSPEELLARRRARRAQQPQ
jgi:hypothetical protein